MSLTQAIALNESTGALYDNFEKWYETAINRKKTIFDALDRFARPSEHFDFGVGFDFVYQISEGFHFVPAVEDLYWMELEVFDRDGVKDFIRRLLGKISSSPKLPQYKARADRKTRSAGVSCDEVNGSRHVRTLDRRAIS